MTARGRKLLALTGLGLALLAAATAALAIKVWRGLERPFKGYSGATETVVVAPGSSARAILGELEAKGVLADATLARAYLVYGREGAQLKAGEYLFSGPLSARQVLGKLIAGEVVERSVTVIEGLTLEEIADHLAAEGFGERDALLAAMRTPEAVRDLSPEARDLEGYLFPETYHFAAGTPAAEIVAAMVRTFRGHFTGEIIPLEPATGGLTPHQLVTLASIIEKEARRAEERPLIAAVYRNRLRQGIGLYADPTVIYALKRLGRWNGNLTRADLALDSPYNTYRFGGLPPGPIAAPGLASLEAAAAPADVPYLYFVSRNDGSHVFAATLAEHNRNVERWQRRYWRERRAAERKARPH